MPGQRAKVKITKNKSMENCKFVKINKMQANPDKFQVLAVGKKTYEKHPTINIQNFELTCEDSVKLLGIEIDYQLNFDTQTLNKRVQV
jgi:hypothetical protein